MTKNPPGIVIYNEYLEHISLLSMEERGALLTAILEYGNKGEGEISVKLTPCCAMAFSFIRNKIDNDAEKYRDRCLANRENGKKGGRPKSST